jgi:hypothetical protein
MLLWLVAVAVVVVSTAALVAALADIGHQFQVSHLVAALQQKQQLLLRYQLITQSPLVQAVLVESAQIVVLSVLIQFFQL